jgi:hypothetical protein
VISKLVLAGAAAALVATPLAAETPVNRAPATMAGKNEQIVGLLWQYLLLPIIIGAVVALVAGGHDKPASP